MNSKTIDRLFEPLADQALADLARLVNTNSFTGNLNGLKAAGEIIIEIARQNGLSLEKVPAEGDVNGAFHLFAGPPGDGVFYGVIGHFDTVHDPHSPFDRFTDRGERLTGPGVQDMKSGIVSAIYGLGLAATALGWEGLPVKVIFNCDEEIGSEDSRGMIESEMKGAAATFIFEGRRDSDNALVTCRKGIIMGEMAVKGIAAHAGEAPQDGASAIVEAARKIALLDDLNDFEKGISVTIGKISGGKVANQIPEDCTCSIDARFRTAADEKAIRDATAQIMAQPHVQGCTTDYWMKTVRPSYERTPAIEDLKRAYAEAADEFGIRVSEREAGGGSDGNLTAAMGVPTLDGMGPAGDHPHTHDEYIRKASFFNAIKIFALLMTRLVNPK